MQTSNKEKYVVPTVKEHGIVREVTKANSGGRGKSDFGMSQGMSDFGHSMGM